MFGVLGSAVGGGLRVRGAEKPGVHVGCRWSAYRMLAIAAI